MLLLCLVPCTTFPFYHILQPGPWLQSRLPLGVVPAVYILVKDIISMSVGGMIASRLPRLACECSQCLTRECSVDQMCGCNQCQALAQRGPESHQIYSTFVKTCVSQIGQLRWVKGLTSVIDSARSFSIGTTGGAKAPRLTDSICRMYLVRGGSMHRSVIACVRWYIVCLYIHYRFRKHPLESGICLPDIDMYMDTHIYIYRNIPNCLT